jgi:hypothetical protein
LNIQSIEILGGAPECRRAPPPDRGVMPTHAALLFLQPRVDKIKWKSVPGQFRHSCIKKGDGLCVALQHEHGSAAGRFLPKLGGA